MKRIVWIGLLLVLSVLPGRFAHVAGSGEAGGGPGGAWVVRVILIGLVASGIALAWRSRGRKGWR